MKVYSSFTIGDISIADSVARKMKVHCLNCDVGDHMLLGGIVRRYDNKRWQ